MKNYIYAVMTLLFSIYACSSENDPDVKSNTNAKVKSNDFVSTLVGGIDSGDLNGSVDIAKIKSPAHIVSDNNGNLYFTDGQNNKVKKITAEGNVITIAGSTKGYEDGQGAIAKFNSPWGIARAADGTLFVSDGDRIRKITPEGLVSTLAGSGSPGYVDGTGDAASFQSPGGIALDQTGNLYVADMYNSKIRKITQEGVVTTVAGGEEGYADGTGTDAKFHHPSSIAVGSDGNLYITDTDNHRIRKATPAGVVTTVAGDGVTFEGTSEQSILIFPMDLTITEEGVIYVADTRSKIIKIDVNGDDSTLAGTVSGYLDGSKEEAKFGYVFGIEVDEDGNVYACDAWNNAIRKVTLN